MNKETKVTFSDRVLAATVLKLIPKTVTPNQVTIARFISIPFVLLFIFIGQYAAGIILFVLSAFSDAVDGALARTRNQITDWGRVHDPLADKLLIGLTAVFVIPEYLDERIVIILIFIEMILIGTAYYLKNKGVTKIRANAWGKAKMIFQSVGVGLVLLFAVVNFPILLIAAEYILYASIVLALISLVTYSI